MTYYQLHKEKILQKAHDKYLLKKYGVSALGLKIDKLAAKVRNLEVIIKELVKSLNVLDKFIK